MDFVSLDQKIGEAGKEKIRNTHLFEADNFRSWMLYFEPGDGTPMHYHQSPETFLVIEGKCSVKSVDGEERISAIVLNLSACAQLEPEKNKPQEKALDPQERVIMMLHIEGGTIYAC